VAANNSLLQRFRRSFESFAAGATRYLYTGCSEAINRLFRGHKKHRQSGH
jgi:hypothetical protein